MNSFTFNGVNSKDLGVICSGSGTYGAPERDVTVIEIPGRNGNLIYDNKRYRNAAINYPAFVPHDFPANAGAIRAWLLNAPGYRRLTDDYNPGEFRLARYVGGIDFNDVRFLNRAAGFTITFDAKPQRFLTSGETPVEIATSGSAITNPTDFDALPLLHVTGTGDGYVTVNGTTIEIINMTEYMDIDCDTQIAYKGLTPMNTHISAAVFPALGAGENVIAWSGGVTGVTVTPRWWRI